MHSQGHDSSHEGANASRPSVADVVGCLALNCVQGKEQTLREVDVVDDNEVENLAST